MTPDSDQPPLFPDDQPKNAGRMEAAVRQTLSELDSDESDSVVRREIVAVQLVLEYARILDRAPALRAASTYAQVGPKLLQALTALAASRASAGGGADVTQPSALAELRSRRHRDSG